MAASPSQLVAVNASASDRDRVAGAIRVAKRAGAAGEISEALVDWSFRRAACVQSAEEFDKLAAELSRVGAPAALVDRLRLLYRPRPAAGRGLVTLWVLVVLTLLPLPIALVAGVMPLLTANAVAAALLALVAINRSQQRAITEGSVRLALPALDVATSRLYRVVDCTLSWPPPVLRIAPRRARLRLRRARPRRRRAAARRADGSRAGADPGGEPPGESPSPGGTRHRRLTVYRFACLSADERGEVGQ